jgi:hypothetical protein
MAWSSIEMVGKRTVVVYVDSEGVPSVRDVVEFTDPVTGDTHTLKGRAWAGTPPSRDPVPSPLPVGAVVGKILRRKMSSR